MDWFATVLFGFILGAVSIGSYIDDKRMREAFERGYAVQCTGKMGYHWECDE